MPSFWGSEIVFEYLHFQMNISVVGNMEQVLIWGYSPSVLSPVTCLCLIDWIFFQSRVLALRDNIDNLFSSILKIGTNIVRKE